MAAGVPAAPVRSSGTRTKPAWSVARRQWSISDAPLDKQLRYSRQAFRNCREPLFRYLQITPFEKRHGQARSQRRPAIQRPRISSHKFSKFPAIPLFTPPPSPAPPFYSFPEGGSRIPARPQNSMQPTTNSRPIRTTPLDVYNAPREKPTFQGAKKTNTSCRWLLFFMATKNSSPQPHSSPSHSPSATPNCPLRRQPAESRKEFLAARNAPSRTPPSALAQPCQRPSQFP